MKSSVPSAQAAGWRRPTADAIHLAGLTALAVAQPLLDLLGAQAEFLAANRLEGARLMSLVAILLLLPAAVIVLLRQGFAALLPRRAAPAQAVLVGLLVGAIALRAGADSALPGALILSLAALAAGAGGWSYRRHRSVRSVVGLAGAALLVVPGAFLVRSTVRPLWASAAPAPSISPAGAPPVTGPVVFVIFDELSWPALLDGEGRLDSARYPGFARLAAIATVYDQALTVSDTTAKAVPALLTGRFPRRGALPRLADHPVNLFTLLGAHYEMHALEQFGLLPAELLRHADSAVAPSRLLLDLAVVYAHLLTPAGWRDRLPAIDQTWSGFADFARWRPDRRARWTGFVGGITAALVNMLHFAHLPLPHLPFEYLPSGRRYRFAPQKLDGILRHDTAARLRLYRRYLLQLGVVDQMVSELLDVLTARNLLERSLVVVTSDHGYRPAFGDPAEVSDPGDPLRLKHLFVPLLIKLPGQRVGELVTSPVRSVDVLPMVLDALGLPVPPEIEGELPGFGIDSPARRQHFLGGRRTEFSPALLERRRELIAWQVERFGTGEDTRPLFRGGEPRPELLDRRLEEVSSTSIRAQLELEPASPLLLEPESGLVPVLVRGRAQFDVAPAGEWDVALALNGRIESTAATFHDDQGAVRFIVLLPESAFLPGGNPVRVLLVERTSGEVLLLVDGEEAVDSSAG